MGCFLACFGGDEDRKRRRRRRSNRSLPPQRNEIYIPRRRSPSPKRLALEAADSELSLREKPEREEPLCESPSKELLKEEAGDLVRKLSVGEKPEHDGPPSESPLKKSPSEEIAGDLIPEPREESKHGTPLPESSPMKLAVVVADDSVSASREKSDQEGSTGSRKKVTFDLNVITYEAALGYDELRDSLDDEKEEEKEIRTARSPCAYPLNHRYQDCASSDDEDVIDDEEEDYDDSDIDEEDGDEVGFHVGIEENEEESYESFFSLPLEKAEVNNSIEVNSPNLVVLANRSARDRSRYVHSVLNPVENLTKWKEVKDGEAPPKNSMKENANSEPTIKTRTPAVRASRNHSTQHEVSVDTSLSTWLVAPEKTQLEVNGGSHSIRSASSLSREEQPILGALTVEDIKQSSVTSSPRRSPSRNPDDTPIVGTVGSYWNSNSIDDSSATSRLRSVTKGIPNSTSKYRERLRTCQEYIDREGLSQQSLVITTPKYHKRYILPVGAPMPESGKHAAAKYQESSLHVDDFKSQEFRAGVQSTIRDRPPPVRKSRVLDVGCRNIRSISPSPRGRSSSPSRKMRSPSPAPKPGKFPVKDKRTPSPLPSSNLRSGKFPVADKRAVSPLPNSNPFARSGSLSSKSYALNSSSTKQRVYLGSFSYTYKFYCRISVSNSQMNKATSSLLATLSEPLS